MYNPFSLEGKKVLVTGASSGIGKSIAIECSKLGAHLTIVGRNQERLNETFISLDGDKNNHNQLLLELTDYERLESSIKELPVFDGVVNCAGIGTTNLFQFLTREKMQHVFDVNFFSPVELTRLLIKRKKIAKNGSVVFLSSIDGPINSHIGNSSYSATKAALAAMAKGMAVELAPKNIRVNYLMPGQTETPLIHNEFITEDQLALDMEKYPMKRYGRPEEIAYAAIYFLSDVSTFTTGAGLVIDGGFTLI